jgi:hypothetical protein
MNTTRLGMLALATMVTCAGALSGCAAVKGGGAAAPAVAPAAPMDARAAEGYVEATPSPAPPPPPAADAPEPVAGVTAQPSRMKEEQGPRKDRPGLGTEWGETRQSSMSFVDFERADPSSPFVTASLFYNDEEGARAMASTGVRRIPGATFDAGGGLVSMGLRDEGGRFFGGFVARGHDYVVGEAGHRYTIVVKNRTDLRLEIVLSVDGLDVRDGKSAAFAKRGYILDPRAELEIDGFRQNVDEVAAFRFGSVRGSYAGQKYGDTRNVGVIGLAIFHEVGTFPGRWTADEIERRRSANPFPAEFATPPGR